MQTDTLTLTDLIAAVESLEFEHDGWLQMSSFRPVGDGVELDLVVKRPDLDDEDQAWRLSCEHALAYTIERPWGGFLSVASSHPLLWPHTEQEVGLYFSQAPEDPSAVIAELLREHEDIAGEWYSISDFVNTTFPITRLLELGHGQLASGPAYVCKRYFQVLAEHGMSPTLVDQIGGPAGPGSDTPREPEVLLFGESHIVGSKFEASCTGVNGSAFSP